MPQTLKCHILKIRLRQHKAEKGICQFLMTSEGLTVTIQKEDAFPSLVFFFFTAKVTDENFWPSHKSEC